MKLAELALRRSAPAESFVEYDPRHPGAKRRRTCKTIDRRECLEVSLLDSVLSIRSIL